VDCGGIRRVESVGGEHNDAQRDVKEDVGDELGLVFDARTISSADAPPATRGRRAKMGG
jgi:hypothetical protein